MWVMKGNILMCTEQKVTVSKLIICNKYIRIRAEKTWCEKKVYRGDDSPVILHKRGGLVKQILTVKSHLCTRTF